jgi:hypothetical protein
MNTRTPCGMRTAAAAARLREAKTPNTAEPLPDIRATCAPAPRRHPLSRDISDRRGNTAFSRSLAGYETPYRNRLSLLPPWSVVNVRARYAAAVETPGRGTATTNHVGTLPREECTMSPMPETRAARRFKKKGTSAPRLEASVASRPGGSLREHRAESARNTAAASLLPPPSPLPGGMTL